MEIALWVYLKTFYASSSKWIQLNHQTRLRFYNKSVNSTPQSFIQFKTVFRRSDNAQARYCFGVMIFELEKENY